MLFITFFSLTRNDFKQFLTIKFYIVPSSFPILNVPKSTCSIYGSVFHVLTFCSTKLFSNLVSLCINKCVESVELRLKHFPHSLHSNSFSALWIALKYFKIYFIHVYVYTISLLTCVELNLFRDQRFCCRVHRQMAYKCFHYKSIINIQLIIITCFHCDFF